MDNKETREPENKKWLGLVAVALPTLLISIDTSVLYLALPHLSVALKANSAQQLWIMDIYGFMLAGFLITMGNVGDRIGYRRLLIIGSTFFGLASAMAAFSTNPNTLIATRAIMGIAGATLMPSTLALIRNMFIDQKQRGIAISVWISCLMVGMVAGPLVGGLLLEYFWWGSVFLLGVPVMIVVVLTGRILIPEFRHNNSKHLDIIGVFCSLAAILPLIYGLTEFSRNNIELFSVTAIITGVIFSIVFIYREKTNSESLLELTLFKNSIFSTMVVTMLLVAVVLGGVALYIAQYLQMVLEFSPLKAGLWMIPQALAMVLGSLLIPILVRTYRPVYIITAGLALSTTGMSLITFMPDIGGLSFVITGFVLSVLGASPVLVLGTGIIIESAPVEKAGVASSISETSNQLGVALGVAILGSIGTFVYHIAIDEHIPYFLSNENQTIARESIAGAHSVASIMNLQEGAALRMSAKTAYINGFRFTSGIGALIFVFSLLFVAIKFLKAKRRKAYISSSTSNNLKLKEMSTVTSKDGTTIAYEKSGSGPAVILVDGAFCGKDYGPMVKIVPLLSQFFTVITYDRRGRGESSDTQPYTVKREIEDLDTLITLAGGSAHLFGISSGAILCIKAANSGLKIKKLALFEPPFVSNAKGRRPADAEQQLRGLISENKNGEACEFYLRKVIGVPAIVPFILKFTSNWSKMKRNAASLPNDAAVCGDFNLPKEMLNSISLPTLVIGSLKSPQSLRNPVEAVARALPNGEPAFLKGAVHDVPAKILVPVLEKFFQD